MTVFAVIVIFLQPYYCAARTITLTITATKHAINSSSMEDKGGHNGQF